MLRGLGRSPFGPRSPFGASPPPNSAESPPAGDNPLPGIPAPPPPPPQPARRSEPAKEADPAVEQYETLKRHIHIQLVDQLDMNRVSEMDPKTLRNEIRSIVEHLCDTENPLLNRNERQRLVNEILDETFGFGPLELLLKDDKIGDIMINGPKKIFIEKEGRIQRSEVVFRDSEHLLQIIDRIVSRVGRRVDETSPMVDARLPNGSRFNAIIPPLALDGPVVTIRMFGSRPLSKDDLLRFKAFTPEMLALMEGAMKARAEHRDLGRNRLREDHAAQYALELHPGRSPRHHNRGCGRIAAPARPRGAPGDASGQHRGPGCHHRHRPGQERPADAARPDHHRRVPGSRDTRHDPGNEYRPRGLDDHGPCQHASRCHEPARNDDQHGRTRTTHPRPARQFAAAIDLILQASRLQGGPRKVTSISEVVGMEGDTIIMQEIFAFRQVGVDPNGRAFGEFISTGIRPTFMDRLEYAGYQVSPDIFRQRVLLKD